MINLSIENETYEKLKKINDHFNSKIEPIVNMVLELVEEYYVVAVANEPECNNVPKELFVDRMIQIVMSKVNEQAKERI